MANTASHRARHTPVGHNPLHHFFAWVRSVTALPAPEWSIAAIDSEPR